MTREEAKREILFAKREVMADSWIDKAYDVAIKALEQPEQRWIPCEEALPEEETYVLISKKPSPLSGKKWCVTIAGRFIDGRSGKVEWRDIGFGRIYDDDVLAWMPRPERYIGEQE